MEIKIPTLGDMPTPVKVGVLLASGGGIGAAMVYMPWQAIAMMAAGIALVGFVLMLYSRFLKGSHRRKAAPMERGVLDGASSVPAGISEPARRARLDDLHKKFQTGIERYRAAGKNLYEFPWYLVVGEPGSGKTEAIRHCNIGFPPGLQDELQGVGGTVNMNWWFTDHAVILDTAGRMMFEEIEAGGSEEWKEFLRLLRRYRPNCPINGVFLFIPADSLVKDTADTIEQKAKKISLQFDMIQRTLDVRFPVYIVISKSDLMYGFRDFFEGVEDPELQHQILGWSNVSSLDEPYNPELLEHHLGGVRHRLLRCRSGLLQQAGVEIDAEGERLGRAEGFYAFPLSLEKLVPRMARYLELIFAVGSKWSLKPLFFRGIYFTSAMQQGSALDQDLAGALGVPVDSLPDGRVWMREKAFFLRDLFLKKVFPEKGLVTRATNATRMYIRRKAAVLLAAVISVIALLSFTIYAYTQWKGSVGDLEKYLTVAQTQIIVNGQPIIVDDKYDGDTKVADKDVKDIAVDAHLFYLELAKSVKQYRDKKPWIFRPATFFGGRDAAGADLADALATVYETGVLKPLMKKAAEDLTKADSTVSRSWVLNKKDPSTEYALQVLHDFLAIQAEIPLLGPANIDKPTDEITEAYQRGYTKDSFLDPLFHYGSVPDSDYEKHTPKKDLRDAFELVYYDEKSNPTRLIQAINLDLTMTHALVAAFENYWDKTKTNDPDLIRMNLIKEVSGHLDEFEKAEAALRAVVSSASQDEPDKIHTVYDLWREKFEVLEKANKQLDTTVPKLDGVNIKSLIKDWAEAEDRVNQNLKECCNFLTNDLGAIAKDSELGMIRDGIKGLPGKLAESFKGTLDMKDLETLDGRYYAKAGDSRHLYAIRYELYRNALIESDPNKAVLGLSFAFKDIEKKKEIGIAEIEKSQKFLSVVENDPKNPPTKATPGSDATKALEIAGKELKSKAVDEFLRIAPKKVAAIEEYIMKQSEGQTGDKGTGLPPTESNGYKSEQRYHPRFATEYITDWFLAGDFIEKPKEGLQSEVRKSYDEITPEVNRYLHDYIVYWLEKYPDQLETTLVPVKNGVTLINHWSMNLSDECKELAKRAEYLDRTAITPIFKHISPDDKKLVQVFREELESINNKNLRFEIENLLENWRKSNVQIILTEKLADIPGLVGAFFPPAFFEKVQSGQFVHLQIQKLIADSLADLANDFQKQETEKATNFLNVYGNNFPLSWEATTELSQDQFFKARALWAMYKNFLPSTGGLQGNALLFNLFEKHSDKSIQRRLSKIETNLKQLKSLTLPDGVVKKFSEIGQMMNILPQDPAKPYFCKLTLKSADLLGQTRGTSVQQGSTKKLLEVIGDSITVQYPGNPLSLTFYAYADESQTGNKAGERNYTGIWGCLKMIKLCPSDLVDVDGTKYRYIWIQRFNPDDGKMQDVMSFAVEFSDKDFSDNTRTPLPIPPGLWQKRNP